MSSADCNQESETLNVAIIDENSSLLIHHTHAISSNNTTKTTTHGDSESDEGSPTDPKDEDADDDELTIWTIICILSTSFAYGCIMTTLFLVTLPVECERIEHQHPNFPKSVRKKQTDRFLMLDR
jgi:hypothetical protein